MCHLLPTPARRHPKIVLRLHTRPEFRRRAESISQPPCQVGRNARVAIQHPRQSYSRDSKMIRCRGDRQLAQVLSKHQSGVWRVKHTHNDVPLVIILIVDQDGVFTFEGKCQTPIPADAYGPVVLERAFQRMKPPTRRIHIGRSFRVIEGKELNPQLIRVLGLNSSLRARSKKPFDATMPEALDHSVKSNATRYEKTRLMFEWQIVISRPESLHSPELAEFRSTSARCHYCRGFR